MRTKTFRELCEKRKSREELNETQMIAEGRRCENERIMSAQQSGKGNNRNTNSAIKKSGRLLRTDKKSFALVSALRTDIDKNNF